MVRTNIVLGYKDKVEKDRRYAGYWVLRTDLKERPAIELIKIYKGLWVIEDTFREIKSALEVRPVRHYLVERVSTHIWICVLAQLIEKIAEIEVRRKDVSGEYGDMGGITGERIFRTFGVVILNENSVRNNTGRRWFTVTELTDK